MCPGGSVDDPNVGFSQLSCCFVSERGAGSGLRGPGLKGSVSLFCFVCPQATWMEGNTFSDGQVLGFHSYGVLMLFGSLLQSNVRM